MTQEQFYTWLNDPSTMNADSISQLREVIKRFPYFNVAQTLLAKNLKDESHIDQLSQLQVAAVMAPDRKVLHRYVHDRKRVVVEEPKERDVDPVPDKEAKAESAKAESELEHLLPTELIPEPIIYQLEKADLPELPVQDEDEVEEPEPDELSFSDWLAYTDSGKAPERKSTTGLKPNKKSKPKSNLDLIDDFLSEAAQGTTPKRAEFFNPQKAASKSTEQDFTVVSETLASIYVQQEKYELAKQAYEALSLKYPEKSVYFAARLKEINEKQNSE